MILPPNPPRATLVTARFPDLKASEAWRPPPHGIKWGLSGGAEPCLISMPTIFSTMTAGFLSFWRGSGQLQGAGRGNGHAEG